MKEASHFLRNVGFYEEIAILDRHILRYLKKFGFIDEIPRTISKKRYLELEEKLKIFALRSNIPIEFLDFVIMYDEIRDIFK